MKRTKMLGLAVIAAMALMTTVGASSTSATVLCKTTLSSCFSGWSYAVGTEVHAELVKGSTAKLENLSGSTVFTTCTISTFQGTIENTGGDTETVRIAGTLTWGPRNAGCDTTVDTLKTGSLKCTTAKKATTS